MIMMQHLWSSLLRSEIKEIIPSGLRLGAPAWPQPYSCSCSQRRAPPLPVTQIVEVKLAHTFCCVALDHFIHCQGNALALYSLAVMPGVKAHCINQRDAIKNPFSRPHTRRRRYPAGHQILLPHPARAHRCDDHSLKTAEHPRQGAITTKLLLRLHSWLLEDR